MLKKTITFKDLDGNDLTEDFYFNLNKAEITELEVTAGKDGLTGVLNQITKTEDGAAVYRLFEKIVLSSVGKRSDDGRRFIKNQDIVDDFTQTNAYSEMLVEMLQKPETAVEFLKGIIPADLLNTEDLQLPATDDVPAWVREDRDPTDVELRSMSPEQLRDAWARKEVRERAQAKDVTGIQ